MWTSQCSAPALFVTRPTHCRRWPPVEQFLGRTTLQHLFRWIENSRRIQASDSTSTRFDSICCVALQTQQEVSSKASSTSSCKGEEPALVSNTCDAFSEIDAEGQECSQRFTGTGFSSTRVASRSPDDSHSLRHTIKHLQRNLNHDEL